MRNYELTFIVRPEVDEEGMTALINAVKGLVARSGGQVVRVDLWGLRRLAYPIQKLWEGQYVLMLLDLDPQGITELERGLKLNEQILRHLVVRLEEEEAMRPESAVAEVDAAVAEVDAGASVEE